jgi:hypothetical protein
MERMRFKRTITSVAAIVLAAGMALPGVTAANPPVFAASSVPKYQHIFEIMMENQNYGEIIGNSNAPQINALAQRFGLATNYFGVTHPSEPNYVANIGGSYFGIQDDNQYYCTPALADTDPTCSGTTVDHTINAPNLADQLTAAGLTWKGYFQSLPPFDIFNPTNSGPFAYKWPTSSHALYASKHNPFVNFVGTRSALQNMVDVTQLATDVLSGTVANFSFIVPDQCHDMHGTGSCEDNTGLIQAGDAYVGFLVNEIMSSATWQNDTGNDAIVITWDEDDYSDAGQPGTGCCNADPGGGRVVTIVITNHGAGGIKDNTPYNHYSLLRTFQDAFGLGCLQNTCDTANVKSMTGLF